MSTASLIQIQASFAPFHSSSSHLTKHTFLAVQPSAAFIFPSQNCTLDKQSLVILVGRIFSSSSSTLAEILISETAKRIPLSEYLVVRLGFSQDHALDACKKLQIRRKRPEFKSVNLIYCENADNVIRYLQDENECGLDISHIKQLIHKVPSILTADVDKTIKPKIKVLQDLGFSSSDLTRVLSINPTLYLDRDLGPAIQALRGIMGSDEKVVRFFRRLGWGSTSGIFSNLIPNVTMLEDEFGIPREEIQKLLPKQPSLFMIKNEAFRDGLYRMENKWGISRDSKVFLNALHPFCALSDENINAKCQVFRSFGWPEETILSSIRRYPNLLTCSQARIKKSLEFCMNELGYDPAYLATRPCLFSFSLENRVLPRYRVLSILKEKGLVKESYQLYTALLLTDSKFFDKFIRPYPDLKPKLVELYVNGKVTE